MYVWYRLCHTSPSPRYLPPSSEKQVDGLTTSPRLSHIQDCYPRRDPELYLGRTLAGAAKAGTCQGRQPRRLVPGHGRGAAGREPGRYIAQVRVSLCRGKAAPGERGLGQTGRVTGHGQEASDRRWLGWLEIAMTPSERPGKGSSQSSWACPQQFHPLCALCCGWVRSFPLPLPLRFCGEVTSLAPNRTRAEQTLWLFPSQGRSGLCHGVQDWGCLKTFQGHQHRDDEGPAVPGGGGAAAA